MRLTSFTDFALRALMRLAGEPTRSFATNEIAAEFGISRNHLAKVVRDLADSGFISTQRGVGGGFTLARPAQSITIGEVVRALEGPALVECFREDGGSCALKLCVPQPACPHVMNGKTTRVARAMTQPPMRPADAGAARRRTRIHTISGASISMGIR